MITTLPDHGSGDPGKKDRGQALSFIPFRFKGDALALVKNYEYGLHLRPCFIAPDRISHLILEDRVAWKEERELFLKRGRYFPSK